MLEIREYSKPEMSAMFGTKDMEGLKRKLKRYGITFDVKGRGENAHFIIREISNPFKIYCITEFGFDGGTDFVKLLYFLYFYFNDDEFRALPDEVKEVLTEEHGHKISRQTIANYTAKLERNNLIDRNTKNYIYYFAFKQTQRMVEKEEYLKAWHEHWARRKEGLDNYSSIMKMFDDYGGVARKQAIPEINGIYNEQIEYLNTLIIQSIEKDIKKQN